MASELQQIKVVKATFNPTANTGERTIAAHGLGKFIPDNAVIIGGVIDVITTCTTASGDAGTLAIHVNGADDIVTAIAVSAALNVWDTGLHGVLPGAYAEAAVGGDTAVLDKARQAASYIKTTAVREITATIATQAFTAGKMDIFLFYFITE